MLKQSITISLILLTIVMQIRGQNKEVERLMQSEFKMTFPSVYFKNNSTEFADMPYSADSCFRYIARNMENINSMLLWRDSSENDELTKLRKKKI